MEPNAYRWTAGKKTALVILTLKEEKTTVDACRENDLKRSEFKKWIEQSLEGGTRTLTVNSDVVMVRLALARLTTESARGNVQQPLYRERDVVDRFIVAGVE